ncbi:hypothetical protein IQ07DRAFT_499576 [Pyrenochaeta sp. DS3sAY3a]|nr:hypothetical protein IQ07DRAFT_499576 [Pyrenochaeta sp. DS3sAY3a]
MRATLLPLTLLSSLVTGAPHQRRPAGPVSQKYQNSATTGKAVYFLTNDAQNAVVAVPIDSTGSLSGGTMTSTGGAGSNSIDSATNAKAAPDALIGQSALTIVDQFLFAVNAGSNTITMMAISSKDPTLLTIVGQPAAVPGEFPNTVAASSKNKLVCVGTTGAVAGISCAKFDKSGVGKMDCLRPFDLKQTTPPRGPLNTVSQTFFSNDESTLFTTVKGDPTVNNTGFLSVFNVQQSGRAATLGTKETRSSPEGTAVLFGSAPIPNDPSSLFVTDASFGAAVLQLDSQGLGSVKGKQAIDGQKATCWATISRATNSAFVTDVAVNRVVEMSLKDASILGQLDLSANADPGLIDLKAAGNFIYALSPGNGTTQAAVTVLDVCGGQGSLKQMQHFELKGLAGKNAQGMAVLL